MGPAGLAGLVGSSKPAFLGRSTDSCRSCILALDRYKTHSYAHPSKQNVFYSMKIYAIWVLMTEKNRAFQNHSVVNGRIAVYPQPKISFWFVWLKPFHLP